MEPRTPRRTRVKMCGTTRLEDALGAARLGVDALGFIFYAKSPRCVSRETVAAILAQLPPFVDRVGVFVDAPLAEVVQTVASGLSCVQLHGNESPEYCRELRALLPCCGLLKAFRVSSESSGALFAPYETCVDAFLLDTYMQGAKGGTGEVFDWSIIDKLKLQRPVVLAGGLSPENVAQAVSEVEPYAVDINSGIELQPGVKDLRRLQTVMQMVGNADRHSSPDNPFRGA